MALTARQEAALAKAPPAARAAMRKGFLAQRGPAPSPVAVPMPRFSQPRLPGMAKVADKPRPARKAKAKAAPRAGGGRLVSPYRHLPLPELEAPYAVLNLPTVIEFSTSSLNDTCLFFGSLIHNVASTSEAYISMRTDYVAIRKDANVQWSGNNLQSWRSSILDTLTPGTNDTAMEQRLRLNGVKVEVRCTGASGLYPAGEIFLGKVAMYDYVTRGDASPTLMRTMITPAINTGRIIPFTATDLLRGVHFACAPDDIGAFKQWSDTVVPSSIVDVGSLEVSRGLELGVVYIPPLAGSTTNYKATITCEWCLRNPSIVAVNALSRAYTPTPLAVWNAAMAEARDRAPRHK